MPASVDVLHLQEQETSRSIHSLHSNLVQKLLTKGQRISEVGLNLKLAKLSANVPFYSLFSVTVSAL